MSVVMLIVVVMTVRSCNDGGDAGGGRRGREGADPRKVNVAHWGAARQYVPPPRARCPS